MADRSEPKEVERRYGKGTSIGSFVELTREERAAKYQRDMADQQLADIMLARSQVVAKFRSKSGGYDAPDTPLYRWYVPDDWTDDGTFIGLEPPAIDAAGARALLAQADKATRLAAARQALSGAESALGIKPYVPPPVTDKPETDVTASESVTGSAPSSVTDKRCANPGCGKLFKPLRSDALYCSGKCRVDAHRAR